MNKRGDMLAIMDYLHHVVPEYCFKLRPYSGAGVVAPKKRLLNENLRGNRIGAEL